MSYYLKCSKCNLTLTGLHMPISVLYELEKGISVTSGRSYVWCSDCKDIKYGENLPTIEELIINKTNIEIELQELNIDLTNLKREYNKRWFFKNKQLEKKIINTESILLNKNKYLTKLLLEIKWLSQRISAPRCLSCGSINIIYPTYIKINESQKEISNFKHDCGGTINLIFDDFHASWDPMYIKVDSEGRRLYEDNIETNSFDFNKYIANIINKNSK